MPQNKFQRFIFALLTVVITVHAYVFYSLYVVNGTTLMTITGASGVLDAIKAQGGVMMFGAMLPIWAIILIEFICAITLEITVGSPLSFKLACRVFDPRKDHPMLFESAIICATVGLMCPIMSFLAAWMYYPYYAGFSILTLFANWLKLVCFNLPFAYFTQLFFIQPFVRFVFGKIFRRQMEKRNEAQAEAASRGEQLRPADETEAIADLWKRIAELDADIGHEHRKRKELEVSVNTARENISSLDADIGHEHRKRKELEASVDKIKSEK